MRWMRLGRRCGRGQHACRGGTDVQRGTIREARRVEVHDLAQQQHLDEGVEGTGSRRDADGGHGRGAVGTRLLDEFRGPAGTREVDGLPSRDPTRLVHLGDEEGITHRCRREARRVDEREDDVAVAGHDEHAHLVGGWRSRGRRFTVLAVAVVLVVGQDTRAVAGGVVVCLRVVLVSRDIGQPGVQRRTRRARCCLRGAANLSHPWDQRVRSVLLVPRVLGTLGSGHTGHARDVAHVRLTVVVRVSGDAAVAVSHQPMMSPCGRPVGGATPACSAMAMAASATLVALPKLL